jgi:tetratricopeptide (TPR) repeat protein
VIGTRLPGALLVLVTAVSVVVSGGGAVPIEGITAASRVSRAYDTVLDADFDALPATLAETCPPAPTEACQTLAALGLWWQIALDPDDRALDRPFTARVDGAIAATEAWTRREPERAEAWFYVGAAYGARVQWRILRKQRLAAARDGKRIKEALERALMLDPSLHDANFGLGLYRYYAAVAPAALRMVQWMLGLPGGSREGGLTQMHTAREHGAVVRGEADYQLHVIYLWYEQRFEDGLDLVKSLQARYPRNPLFHLAEAEIVDTYFHDPSASRRVAEDLLLRARDGLVNQAPLAEVRARLQLAVELDKLDETDLALEHLEWIVTRKPASPHGILPGVSALRRRAAARLAHEPYRVALDGWRAYERGDLTLATRQLEHSLALDPADPVTRYRYACVLLAQLDEARARAELERVLTEHASVPPVTLAAAHFDLARLLEQRGDDSAALSHYEAASQVFGADQSVKDAALRAAAALKP